MRAELIQSQWARLLVRSLFDGGVTHFVVSPGSRSTPLAFAVAALGPSASSVIIDERAAGFYALGRARATGLPVALVCTSGSAAAHYLPALMEAAYANHPLVVLTADRPPELWQCGAPQTIDQTKLYGAYVRGFFALGTPDAAPFALRSLRRTAAQALALATGAAPGPVHLNVPLRKPLEPAVAQTSAEVALAAQVDELLARPVARTSRTAHLLQLDAIIARLRTATRGIIAVAALPAAAATELGPAIVALARATGFVVIAEAGSNLRWHAAVDDAWVHNHEALLASTVANGTSARAALAPDCIVQIGGELAASAWISARLSWNDATGIFLHAREYLDPHAQAHAVLVGDIAQHCMALAAALQEAAVTNAEAACPPAVVPSGNATTAVGPAASAPAAIMQQRAAYRACWQTWQGAVHRAYQDAVTTVAGNEAAAIASVVRHLPNAFGLALGNSLPIRLIDQVVPPGTCGPAWVVTQRGTNGIDGLFAASAGARARGPHALLLGDVSAAHDLGSLAVLARVPGPLPVVIIDNGGGHIFDTLPVSHDPALAADRNTYFTTPPQLDFCALGTAFGLPTVSIQAGPTSAATDAGVAAALAAACVAATPYVIVIRCAPTGAVDVARHAAAALRDVVLASKEAL